MDKPDEWKGRDFFGKPDTVLAGNPPQVYERWKAESRGDGALNVSLTF